MLQKNNLPIEESIKYVRVLPGSNQSILLTDLDRIDMIRSLISHFRNDDPKIPYNIDGARWKAAIDHLIAELNADAARLTANLDADAAGRIRSKADVAEDERELQKTEADLKKLKLVRNTKVRGATTNY